VLLRVEDSGRTDAKKHRDLSGDEDIASAMTDIGTGMPKDEAAKAWGANPEEVQIGIGEE
jgi:hypothetical protein